MELIPKLITKKWIKDGIIDRINNVIMELIRELIT
jgi:hypothetical protein